MGQPLNSGGVCGVLVPVVAVSCCLICQSRACIVVSWCGAIIANVLPKEEAHAHTPGTHKASPYGLQQMREGDNPVAPAMVSTAVPTRDRASECWQEEG